MKTPILSLAGLVPWAGLACPFAGSLRPMLRAWDHR